MKIYLIILLLFIWGNLFGLLEKFDFSLMSGFTTSRLSGKEIKLAERDGFKYKQSHGALYGASVIFKGYSKFEIEAGGRYIEKGYEVYSRHHQHYHYRNHYYHLHRKKKDKFFDEFKSEYIDFFFKLRPDFGDGLEMHDLNVKLQPFLGYAHSYLMDSEDLNIAQWDSSLMLGCDIIFSKTFLLGLEYNRGITNILYEGRADRESFVVNLGIIF